jgi:hypothetical protein
VRIQGIDLSFTVLAESYVVYQPPDTPESHVISWRLDNGELIDPSSPMKAPLNLPVTEQAVDSSSPWISTERYLLSPY